MVPILLASVGEIVTEKSGIVNIGLEGILNLSAFTTAITAFFTDNVGLAILIGTLTGTLIGIIHGIVSTYLRGDQIVTGIGINMVSYGIGVLGLIALWKQHGASPPIPSLPTITIAPKYSISPIAILGIIIAIAIWYWINKTGNGFRLRACGEDPRSAEAMGIKIFRIRTLATILGATLAGLGGSHLVLWIGQFVRGMAAGRGFIALANVAFSGWNPLVAILGAYIFGFLEVLASYLQTVIRGVGAITLTYPIKMLPYIGTLVIISIFRWRAKMPRALGKPYIKE
ncbi:MAG TPA: ABC transporter permease [Desulfurococcaceae archaeon]|nr:ABC transporter permease [Desulfurococcaceae archaeon]